MPDDFGTPEAHDAVARDEKNVQQGADYAVMLDKEMKEMHPRSLGSVKISPQDRAKEYEMMRDAAEAGDPSHLVQFFVDNKATPEQMIQYAKAQEKKR